ncbi:MAG: hypothetical protein ACXWRA_11290 [Pseudobdellovibrionaceae bacterium]
MKMILIFFASVIAGTQASASCTQTLSVGADVVAAVAAAPSGTTICLNNGNYGQVNLYNMTGTKPGYVTLMSASGKGATLSLGIGNSQWIRMDSLTINGGLINSCSQNIQILNSTFTAALDLRNENCTGSLNYLIDGNTFDNVNYGTWEGRLNVAYGGEGVVISNNHFGNGGVADGIQVLAGASGVHIGPGNVFEGILQSICDAGGGAHCDAIQLYGQGPGIIIEGNRFANGDTYIMNPSGSINNIIRNNVFDTGTSYTAKVQLGSQSNLLFSHNTIKSGIFVSFDKFSSGGWPNSDHVLAQNNILLGDAYLRTTDGLNVPSCDSCTLSYNLFGSAGNSMGANDLIGAPTFVGGINPLWPAGYQLTSTSLGYKNGSDLQDRGTNFYGSGTTATPAPTSLNAPTNLRIVSAP